MQTNHTTDTQNKQALNTTESHLAYDTNILDTLKKDDPVGRTRSDAIP